MEAFITMDNINFRLFTIPFYRYYLGFWILVLVFGGVFMEIRQHVLLGKFLFQHPLAFSILPIGFLTFSAFHLAFQLSLLRRHEYQFFHQTGLFPIQFQVRNWAIVWLSTHTVPVGYLIFLSYFGIEKNAWILLFILWACIFLAIGCSVLLIHRSLGKPIKEAVLLRPRWNGHLPRVSWFALELRQNRPILLLLTKGLSLLLLNGFFLSYLSGSYDQRWLEFGVLCVAFFQIPILMEKNEFENSRMAWFKNLPSPFPKKLLTHLGSLVLVLSPELLFLFWKGLQLSAWNFLIPLPLMLISIVLAVLGLLYKDAGTSFFRFAFGSFFGYFLLILFGIAWFIPVLACLLFFGLQVRSSFQL